MKQFVRELRSFAARHTVGDPKLSRGLDRRPNKLEPWIEKQRAKLLENDSLIVDGSLGPGGPYDEGATIANICRTSTSSASTARYLYSLAAEYGANTVLELGTNLGISAAYLAAAGGRVTTLEASAYRIRIAKNLHAAVGLDNIEYVHGLFSETLDETLKGLPPIDLAFIDGHHQHRPTIDYYETIRPHASEGCVFIFDDIRWSDGMKRAWAELKPRFTATAEVAGMGVAV